MLIVEQGKVVEVCAEPGEFTYDTSTEPSIFSGNLGDSIKQTFQVIGKRFTYGGDTGKDQRVYYINTKEMGEILYGTATPVPFRVIVNEELGYKLSVDIRCNGNFTYRICDPLLFYTNVCGNVEQDYESEEISGRLKGELMTALQPALSTLSAKKVQYYEIPAHTQDLSDALNEVLSKTWKEKRGIEVFSFNINSLSIPEDQRTLSVRNGNSAAVGNNVVISLCIRRTSRGTLLSLCDQHIFSHGIAVEKLFPLIRQCSAQCSHSCSNKSHTHFSFPYHQILLIQVFALVSIYHFFHENI